MNLPVVPPHHMDRPGTIAIPFSTACAPYKPPSASWGTATSRMAEFRHSNAVPTLAGMAGGVAFGLAVPGLAVPGLAPGAFMRNEGPAVSSRRIP